MSNTKTLKTNINQDKLRSFTQELAKGVKTQANLADLFPTLLKMTVKVAWQLSIPREERFSIA